MCRDARSAERLAEEFLHRCPRKGRLNPGVRSLLDALSPDHALHVITNGFQEVQGVKLHASGIGTSSRSYSRATRRPPPNRIPRIFHKAMDLVGAAAEDSLMVGDDPRNDVEGARGVGMYQAHYVITPAESPDSGSTYRFGHFDELRELLGR
ncbi:MAG: HAD hydrolase-like protein [Flavobacteriales bacterium]|nr:HAD hydrolase-like protein [Flavobacteriales bacterium]